MNLRDILDRCDRPWNAGPVDAADKRSVLENTWGVMCGQNVPVTGDPFEGTEFLEYRGREVVGQRGLVGCEGAWLHVGRGRLVGMAQQAGLDVVNQIAAETCLAVFGFDHDAQ